MTSSDVWKKAAETLLAPNVTGFGVPLAPQCIKNIFLSPKCMDTYRISSILIAKRIFQVCFYFGN